MVIPAPHSPAPPTPPSLRGKRTGGEVLPSRSHVARRYSGFIPRHHRLGLCFRGGMGARRMGSARCPYRTNALSKSPKEVEGPSNPRRCHPPPTSLESARATRAGAAVPGAAAPAPTRRGFPAPGATCVRSASHRPAEPRLKRRLQDTLLCGPARWLDVPVGNTRTRGPRRADDGSVSRAQRPRRAPRPPDPSGREPPRPIARAPRERVAA